MYRGEMPNVVVASVSTKDLNDAVTTEYTLATKDQIKHAKRFEMFITEKCKRNCTFPLCNKKIKKII